MFLKLDVWKRSYQLAKKVMVDMKSCRDYGFKDQIMRSALSIPSNIAEGEERETANEAARFHYIAKGSCGELYTQILLAQDLGYLTPQKAEHYLIEAQNISKMLAGLIKYRKGTVR